MSAAFSLALLALQSPPPVVSYGASTAFIQAALNVESKLIAGDVPGAREAAKGLPQRTPRLLFVDEGMPPSLKEPRTVGLTRVIASWNRYTKDIVPAVGAEAGDVTVRFADQNPDGPDGLPQPTIIESETPFRAVISLHRGKPGVPLRAEELNMEMAYILGRYFGVRDNSHSGSAMTRDGRPNLLTFLPSPSEAKVATENLALADRLRAAVEEGKPTGLAAPSIRLITKGLDLPEVLRGKRIVTGIEVENTGTGPLNFKIEPDCGCFNYPAPVVLAPGSKTRIQMTINTMDYEGRVEKTLLLKSNDPGTPSIDIPVVFRSRPGYRIFRPGGENVLLPDEGGTYDVFLFTKGELPFRPLAARLDGIGGKVTMSPWSGPLADPDMGEGPSTARKGYRFRIRIPGDSLQNGRLPETLTVQTDSALFGTIVYTLNVFKGIVAEPVYMGDIVSGTRASILVSRPNAPFKILGVDAGALKAKWRESRGSWEYVVELEYAGGASKGEFSVPVKIRTDDPKQPLIEVTASGFVK